MSSSNFSVLEQTILKAKGLTEDQLAFLTGAGVAGKGDFATIGSVETLLEVMPELSPEVAQKVMDWAVGVKTVTPHTQSSGGSSSPESTKVIIDSADVTYCIHCNAKQPKDYKSGDLCPSCGKQAEPVQSCYWCGQGGPGRFCRGCGAEFVPISEFELAVLLKREGVSKEEISRKLKFMTAAEKDDLWGRARRIRG